ncbi:hypothetical protein FE257_012330 [Aspergillus nanangensis]|uniref:Uncharacterized protein n=1 Tax=Aspergillus nanangensis TaxID=2582783 RepID=A0AAD4CHE8_ASPNN|nr:hypothetical protein FE257_012330 [Aspergillus nanangensis]
MELLELPLEIFRQILTELIYNIDPGALIQLQLVNKTFAREAMTLVFSTRRFRVLDGLYHPSAPRYLCKRAFAPDADDFYAIRTIRHTANWMAGQSGFLDRPQQICLSLSRSAVVHKLPILWDALGRDEKREGGMQTSDALEHRLSAAACLGDLSLVKTLIADGANVNGQSDILGTPLANASLEGHSTVVQFLLNEGADIDGGATEWTEAERKTVETWSSIILPLRFGATLFPTHGGFSPRTPLGAAAFAGQEETVKILLDPSRNLSRSTFGFYHSITYAAIGGNVEVLRMIMNAGDLDTLSKPITKRLLDSALKASASKGHLASMKILLDSGAPVHLSIPQEYESSALVYAAQVGRNDAIKLLLDKGADVSDDDDMDFAPLGQAIQGDYIRTVALLLDHGARVYSYKMRALPLAGDFGSWAVMKLLLEKSAHRRDPIGAQDAVKEAERRNRPDIAALLRASR